MKIDKFSFFMMITAGVSLITGTVLYLYSSGNWKNHTFKTQAEASQAAENWIRDGGIYIVKLHRSQLMEIPRNKDVVEQEISELLEIEAGERKKCMKMLESIEGTDQYEVCMEKFFNSQHPADSIAKTTVEKVDVIIKEERFRRDCKPLTSDNTGYVCGEHDIKESAVISEREERNLRANLKLTYFYVRNQDA